jgi:hypothetical protein
MNVSVSNKIQVKDIFKKIPEWPIYEGFFRYAYVLARKQSNGTIIAACEASNDFQKHYLNNLSLLSADIQTSEDVGRVKAILKDKAAAHDIQHVSWFLFRKREDLDHLNIRILLDHVSSLNDEESKQFFRAMFNSSFDFRDSKWRDKVSDLLNSFNQLSRDKKLRLGVPTLALALYFAPYARWDVKEATLNFFEKFQLTQEVGSAIEACENAASVKVQSCLKEIAEEREEP